MTGRNALPGWMTRPLLELEAQSPGFICDYLATPGRRRQALAAALALLEERRKEDACLEPALVETLRGGSCRDMLRRVAGQVHPAFLPLLDKEPEIIRERGFYTGLHRWLLSAPSAESLKALRHVRRFNLVTLEVLDTLDPVAVHPVTLDFIPNVHNARILNAQIALCRKAAPKLSEATLRRHIETLGRKYRQALRSLEHDRDWFDQPDEFYEGLQRHFVFPAPPIRVRKPLKALRTGRQMQQAARSFRNCLGSCIADVVKEKAYFFIWTEEPQAVVKLVADRPLGWRIDAILAAENSPPARTQQRLIRRHLREAGALDQPAWDTCLLEDIHDIDAESFLREWEKAQQGPLAAEA